MNLYTAYLNLISIIIAWIFPHSATPIQTGSQLLRPNTLTYIEHLRTKYDVQGLSIALVKLDHSNSTQDQTQIVNLGYSTSSRINVTDDTLFTIASNSKLFTALSIGLLVENGTTLSNGHKLSWTTKIGDIFPDWEFGDKYTSEMVTVLDFLSMRSGLPGHEYAISAVAPEVAVKRLRYLELSHQLRETFQYTNLGCILLSEIIPTLTGIPFPEFVKQYIFEPLNMSDTYYNATEALDTGRRSEGFIKQGRDGVRCKAELEARSEGEGGKLPRSCVGKTRSLNWWTDGNALEIAGWAGIITSPVDMVKWLKALLRPSIFSSDLLRTVIHAVSIFDGQNPPYPEMARETYGLAQWLTTYKSHSVAMHLGSMPGQQSVLIRAPNDGVGIVVMTNDNTFGSGVARTIGWRCLEDLLGLESSGNTWEGRYISLGSASQPSAPEPKSWLPDEELLGRYSHPGYGLLDVAHLDQDEKLQQSLFDRLPASLARNASSTLISHRNESYIAPFVLFTPYEGRCYNWTSMIVYNTPQGEQMVGVEGTGWATFEGDKIGVGGGWWGAWPEWRFASESQSREVEVWFRR